MVHLPQELLSHICSYLVIIPSPFEDWDEGWPDKEPVHLSAEDEINLNTMLDISVASSSLHQAVQPYLYRTIIPSMSVIKSLLRTLIEQPSLARLVQNLSTGELWRVEEKQPVLEYVLLPRSSIAATFEGKDLPEILMLDIQSGIDKGSQDALCAVLLLLCTNLKVWMAGFNKDFRNTLVGRMVTHVSASKPALQHLQTVVIVGNANSEGALQLHELRDVLGLPSLRSIRTYNINPSGMVGYGDSNPSVKEIVLGRSFVRWPQSIKALLCAYEQLDILSIENGGPDRDENLIHDFTGIGDVLRQHGTKLQSLEILRADLHEEDTLDRKPLGSLVALTSLERLELTYNALYGGQLIYNERPITWLQEFYLSPWKVSTSFELYTRIRTVLMSRLRRLQSINDSLHCASFG